MCIRYELTYPTYPTETSFICTNAEKAVSYAGIKRDCLTTLHCQAVS